MKKVTLKKVYMTYGKGVVRMVAHWATHDDRFECHDKSKGADRWWLVVDTTGKKHGNSLVENGSLQDCREAIELILDRERREAMEEGRKRIARYEVRDEVAAAVRTWFEKNEDQVEAIRKSLNATAGNDNVVSSGQEFATAGEFVVHMLDDVIDIYREDAEHEARRVS
jgi:hypothetical protein